MKPTVWMMSGIIVALSLQLYNLNNINSKLELEEVPTKVFCVQTGLFIIGLGPIPFLGQWMAPPPLQEHREGCRCIYDLKGRTIIDVKPVSSIECQLENFPRNHP